MNKKNKFSIILLIIAIVWLMIGTILMATVGIDNGPVGGLDKIAEVIAYVFIWRIFTWGIPFLFAVIGILVWLFRTHQHAFKVIIITLAVIVSSIVLYNTIGKQIIYTPTYMANHTESYKEHKFNDFERTKWTEQDRIQSYIYWKLKHIEEDTSWVTDKDKRKQYIEVFMNKRISELPNVIGWEYIEDISIIDGVNIDSSIDYDEIKCIEKHIGKEWNTKHYGFAKPAIHSTTDLLLIYYADDTMDPVN